ncbi:MAG: hypothetical protein RJA16_1907, partial [Planctomycetota bacterium]
RAVGLGIGDRAKSLRERGVVRIAVEDCAWARDRSGGLGGGFALSEKRSRDAEGEGRREANRPE